MRRAEAIIDELTVTLDHERGGEIASRLQGIYAFCRRHLIEATAEQDPNKIEEVSELLTELREAWAEIAGMSSSEAPWAGLVALAEHERDLVRDGRWDELPAASAQRLSAAEALGDPPAEARPHLERLSELQREIHAGLSTGRAFTLQKLGSWNAEPPRCADTATPLPQHLPSTAAPSAAVGRSAVSQGLDPKGARAGRR